MMKIMTIWKLTWGKAMTGLPRQFIVVLSGMVEKELL